MRRQKWVCKKWELTLCVCWQGLVFMLRRRCLRAGVCTSHIQRHHTEEAHICVLTFGRSRCVGNWISSRANFFPPMCAEEMCFLSVACTLPERMHANRPDWVKNLQIYSSVWELFPPGVLFRSPIYSALSFLPDILPRKVRREKIHRTSFHGNQLSHFCI